MKHHITSLFASVSAVFALSAVAAPPPPPTIDISLTAQPVKYDVKFAPLQITGYGRALMGMSVEQVRAAVAADYPGAVSTFGADPTTGRQALTVVAPRLAPGPGPGTINFVFGARSAQLVAVNVSWTTQGPSATADQRAAMVAAARSVAETNAGYDWAPLTSVRGQVLPDGALIVFAGRKATGSGIEIRLDGVELDLEPRAATASAPAVPATRRPPAGGPARLLVAYVADTTTPDDLGLPDGSF